MAENILYRLYEWYITRDLKPEKMPKHVAIIMDGNRRYSKLQGNMDVGLPGSEVDTGERRGIGRSGHVRAEGGGGLFREEVRQDRGRIRRGSIGDESGGNGKAGIGQALLQRILEELLVHERAGR